MTVWYCWSLILSCFMFILTVPVRMAPVVPARLRAGKEWIELSAVGVFYLCLICVRVSLCESCEPEECINGERSSFPFPVLTDQRTCPTFRLPTSCSCSNQTRVFGGVRHAWVKFRGISVQVDVAPAFSQNSYLSTKMFELGWINMDFSMSTDNI